MINQTINEMTSIKLHTLLLLITFFINLPVLAGVYKWTDANGKIHFSDKPHKNSDEIKINSVKPSGVGTSNNRLKRQKELLLKYQNERSHKQKNQAINDKRDADIAKKCQHLKNIIINYEEVDYLFTRDSKGKKRRVSSSQKKKDTAVLQKEYDDKCL